MVRSGRDRLQFVDGGWMGTRYDGNAAAKEPETVAQGRQRSERTHLPVSRSAELPASSRWRSSRLPTKSTGFEAGLMVHACRVGRPRPPHALPAAPLLPLPSHLRRPPAALARPLLHTCRVARSRHHHTTSTAVHPRCLTRSHAHILSLLLPATLARRQGVQGVARARRRRAVIQLAAPRPRASRARRSASRSRRCASEGCSSSPTTATSSCARWRRRRGRGGGRCARATARPS